jgi:hypothetical protein
MKTICKQAETLAYVGMQFLITVLNFNLYRLDWLVGEIVVLHVLAEKGKKENPSLTTISYIHGFFRRFFKQAFYMHL